MLTESDYNSLSTKFFSANNETNLLPSFILNENLDFETGFNINFSSKSSEEEDDLNIFNNNDPFIASILDPYPMPSLNEIIPIKSFVLDNQNDSLSSSEKSNLFSNTEKNSDLAKEDWKMFKRKRSQTRRPRKDNQDNIRKKIRRGFFNNALINKLNEKLKSIGNKQYLRKFPQNFVIDVNQKRNKEFFNMTLLEIFEKKEIYSFEKEEGLNNYLHNLKVLQNEEIKENKEFKKILNKTIYELYEEYINSDEFRLIEINRLKQKKMQDDYIIRYINLAKHLILFYTE